MQLRIKEICKERGIAITKLAELVNISQPNMSNIVNGKVTPSLEKLETIANALNVHITELFAPQPANTITCPHCGTVLEITEKQ